MGQYVKIKVANMRKEQDFIIYPNGTSETHILLQSDKRVATLNKETGVFMITLKSYGYPQFLHLQTDRKIIEISDELKEEIRRGYNALTNGKDGIVRIL